MYALGKPQKKILLLMAGPLRGGGVKGQAIKEKNWNLFFQRSKFQRQLSSRMGGGLGINGPAIKRRTFFAASLRENSS